jgi:hypothetical protein
MLDREDMKIRSEWKKLEESFNSMTLNSIAEGASTTRSIHAA